MNLQAILDYINSPETQEQITANIAAAKAKYKPMDDIVAEQPKTLKEAVIRLDCYNRKAAELFRD